MNYADKLLAWFDINKREMPWRNTTDPYAIWVSEVMLQQTQVDTVIPYYKKFMERFPTIHSLASSTLEEVYTYWQGLGYYRRAENLYKGAQMIDREYGGTFPKDIEKVKKIPGIGPYTLGAVLSIAFHVPIPAVDGNVMRILSRQFLIDQDISIAKNRKIFDKKVMELMPDDPNRFNQALMELGALVCTPKDPKCEVCPIGDLCKGYHAGKALQYPIKTPKVKAIRINYMVFIFKDENKYWMEKRPEEGLLANLWGFPMLEQEVFGAKDLSLTDFTMLTKVSHTFTHRRWEMLPIVVEMKHGRALYEILSQNTNGSWITITEMQKLPIATAFRKVSSQLK